jgi:hypothetical protein
LKTGLFAGPGQGLEEVITTAIIPEYGFPAVFAIDHMIDRPGIFNAHLTRHNLKPAANKSPWQAPNPAQTWVTPSSFPGHFGSPDFGGSRVGLNEIPTNLLIVQGRLQFQYHVLIVPAPYSLFRWVNVSIKAIQKIYEVLNDAAIARKR